MLGGRRDEEVQRKVAAEACLGASRVGSCLLRAQRLRSWRKSGGLGKRCPGRQPEPPVGPVLSREGRVLGRGLGVGGAGLALPRAAPHLEWPQRDLRPGPRPE